MNRKVTKIDYVCEKCGHHIVGATEALNEGGTPEAGDISVCINCGSVGIFEGEPLTIRRLTKEEYDEALAVSQDLVDVLLAFFHIKETSK